MFTTRRVHRQMQFAHPGAEQRLSFGARVTAREWERVLVFRDGALLDELTAATRRVWRSRAAARTVDLRPQVLALPTQEVPTADGVTVKVTVVAVTSTVDAVRYATTTPDPWGVTYLAVQVAVREVLSTTSVDDVLAARGDLPGRLTAAVRGLDDIGVVVDRVELKDVVLPVELRRAQAQVLLARAEGTAALERARGESTALRTLVNAARLAAEHPALLQLRLVQQLGATTGHTVVIGTDAVHRPS
jgi:regulator of protease activity HflC (stomatin/prohibitin superfamily)